MKGFIRIMFIVLGFFSTAYAESPIGYWKTIDDVTHTTKSVIKIYEGPQHLLMGQVIKIFPIPGKPLHPLCQACKGDKQNQPIVGMVVLTDLKAKKEQQWDDGKILDPKNGKTYNCAARLVDNGKKLMVRGYMGLPLLGRSQTWERIDSMNEV